MFVFLDSLLFYIFGLLHFVWNIPLIIIAVCLPYTFYYILFQSKLAMIVLIDNITLLSNVRPDSQQYIKNQIKAITMRHLDIKGYMKTIINYSHHLLYTIYLVSGLIGGLLSIADYFSVIFTHCLNNMICSLFLQLSPRMPLFTSTILAFIVLLYLLCDALEEYVQIVSMRKIKNIN